MSAVHFEQFRFRRHAALVAICCAGSALFASAAGAETGAVAAPPVADAQANASTCLPGERGFLQATLRGAIDARPNWSGKQLQCEGGTRPEQRGLRLSFAGTLATSGQKLRLIFGIPASPGAPRSGPLPANLTVIVEGESRIFATLGDDKCTIEMLVQEPIAQLNSTARGNRGTDYRIAARGFCTSPALALNGGERLYIDRFDFAGRAHFDAGIPDAALAQR